MERGDGGGNGRNRCVLERESFPERKGAMAKPLFILHLRYAFRSSLTLSW